jgi:AcrR family transcriptional regulator
MNLPRENATAPRKRKRISHEETRAALLEAIARLRSGNPRVDRGTGITVSSVAREAGVHRTTIHNHHADIVAQIHGLQGDGGEQQPRAQYLALAEGKRQHKAHRAIVEQLQEDKERLAQHNYALRRENEELKSELTRKSQMLRELTRTRNAADTVGSAESGY